MGRENGKGSGTAAEALRCFPLSGRGNAFTTLPGEGGRTNVGGEKEGDRASSSWAKQRLRHLKWKGATEPFSDFNQMKVGTRMRWRKGEKRVQPKKEKTERCPQTPRIMTSSPRNGKKKKHERQGKMIGVWESQLEMSDAPSGINWG